MNSEIPYSLDTNNNRLKLVYANELKPKLSLANVNYLLYAEFDS